MQWENRLELAWERGYAHARQYYREHGDLQVPARYVAQDGFARAIRPVHTQMDGDTLFALSTGDKECDFMRLSVLATEAVARAIANAGYLARERRT